MFLLTLEETKEFIASITINLNISIYRIFSNAYEVFFRLNSNRIIYNVEYREIYNKVYTLLSILVLFVIAYNILTIIINPERNKGGFAVQKLIQRVILVLITIVLTPTIFNFAFKLQDAVVNDGFFNRLFGFKVSSKDKTGQDVTAYGKYIAGDVLGSFFYPEGNYEDSQIPAESENVGEYVDSNNTKHKCTYNGPEVCTLYKAKDYARNGGLTAFRAFARNIDNPTINRVEFAWIVSLIVGLFLLYVMITYCISFVIRVVKLAIYEIVSPIVLAVSIAPKNDGVLNRWIKAVMKTYVSMFIYIFIMYLSMYLYKLISNITGPLICDTTSCSSGVRSFSYSFFVLGIFGFMKIAPKAMENLLNLNEPINLGIIDTLKSARKENQIKMARPNVPPSADPKSFRNVKLQNIENKTRSIAKNVGNIASGRAKGMSKYAPGATYGGKGAFDRLKRREESASSGGVSKASAPYSSSVKNTSTNITSSTNTSAQTLQSSPAVPKNRRGGALESSGSRTAVSDNIQNRVNLRSPNRVQDQYLDSAIDNDFTDFNKNKKISYDQNIQDANAYKDYMNQNANKSYSTVNNNNNNEN